MIKLLCEDDKKELEQKIENSGLNSTASAFLLTILRNGVYITDQSANITALENALKNSGSSGGESGDNTGSEETEKTLVSISAVYSGGDVTVDTAVTDLTGLTVIVNYSDGSVETVTGYTLSGTIAEGDNIITVSYSGRTTTFTVTGVSDEEEPTGTLIHNWDFTQSVTDSVGGLVAVYGNNTVYQDNEGLHFTGTNATCYIGDIMAHETDFKARRIEIDVANVDYAASRGRLFMACTGMVNGFDNPSNGLIYDGGLWKTYFGAWQASTVSGADLISGKRLIVKQPEPFVYEYYAENTLLTSVTLTSDGYPKGVNLGANAQAFYNIVITGLRVYEEV